MNLKNKTIEGPMQHLTPPLTPASLGKRAHRIWVLFIVSLGIFAASYGWISWQRVKIDAIRHGTQIADLGEKALNADLSQYAVLLELSSQDLLGAHDQLDPVVAQSRLSRLKSAHSGLSNVHIISLDGVLLLSTTPGAKLPAPVVDFESFNESVLELSKGKNFSIGRVVIGALTKEWIIPLRYAVRDSAGTLRFILIATMPLSSPQRVWKDVALPEGMVLGVVRDDGYLMSRYPVPVGLGLTDVYGTPRAGTLMNHLRDKQFPVSGHVEGPSGLDGVNYLFVFRRLSGYPLSFFVIQPLSSVRADWWSDAQIPFLLMLLLLAGGSVVFRRAVRTQTAWEAERNDREKTLREMNLDLDRRIEERTGELRERKLALAEIQKLTVRLQLANQATGIGVWDWDVVSNDLVWDAGMYKLYGTEPEQFSGAYEAWLAGVYPEDIGPANDAVQAALSDIKPYDIEFRVTQPSGDLRWLKAIATVQRDSSGKPLRMIGTNLDITIRKQTDKALIAARDAAQLANRAKDSFLATTSHEIRTPLGGLMGMLEVLSLTSLNVEQRETLLSARDSGRSLLRILDDLLDWSKIEEGKLELAPQPTSIARLMSEVVNTYARLASARSLVLEQEVDAGLSPALIVDPMRLSQVLNNFVSNALKFTHKGGVVVRAQLLGRSNDAERVCFSVTDSGIGIDKDVLPRLFQNYGQGSAETARMYGGTGLGLAICRRLADLLDGRIEVQSVPGEGSTFSITLSLLISTEAVDKQVVRAGADSAVAVPFLFHADAQALAPLVLVVDDHPINRRLLALQLRLLGLRAETAQDGAVALSMWRDGRFAVVITDCHMPKMDGYALAREIRRIEATEARTRTLIIGWTANALVAEEANCIGAGMDELLVKPTELPELRAALSKWLAGAASAPVALAPVDSGYDGPGGTADTPIDLAALNKIAASAADRAEILDDFMAQARADLAELEQALDDLAACERLAHRMKGACRMVGAGELEAVCETMQGAARQGNAHDAHAAYVALSRAMARLEAYLARAEGVNKEKN